MDAVIAARNLERRYGSTHALLPTSLDVAPGSVVALLGHNGAGKTTLLKLLMNLIRPSGGSATVFGEATTSLGGDSFQRIGYVSENQELPGRMTVGAFLRYQGGFYPTWDDATLRSLITRFNLPLKRKLKHLSRGQRMKVALASVLAFRPALIVLDEPLSGLDPLVRDELITALLESTRNLAQPTTILLSSHDLAEIESFATDVAFVHAGRLLFTEPMPSLFARFREVTVTLDPSESTQPPAGIPHGWTLLRETPGTLRFVHIHADREPVRAQVEHTFPNAKSITIDSMPLRAIFLAIVKSEDAKPATVGAAA